MSLLEKIAGHRVTRAAADAGLVRYAHARTRALDSLNLAACQKQTLLRLVRHASGTRFGREHAFHGIRSVKDYQDRVPIRDYEAFWKEYWQPFFPRIEGQTWPGHIPYYALSSGTTSGATKYIPISKEMVSSNRKAGFTTLAFFRHYAPHEQVFNGKIFFLGGNTAMTKQTDGSLAGDLSAIAAIEVPRVIRPYSFPPLELASIADWERKAEALARTSAELPITMFSGVPSWQLFIFQHLKRITGKATIAEIWPDLRLLIHGGTAFDSYRKLFRQEIGSERVRFLEVYPASEGFVATEDPRYDLLRVIPDIGVFFEFVPVEELDDHGKVRPGNPARHTLGNLQTGVQYAVAVTSCAGLWSYLLGDTVLFERCDPPLLRFTGRTKYFLSAFGEHLIAEEIEKGITAASEATGSSVVDHHVGPVFPLDPQKPGHHLFLIEFRKHPADMSQFMRILDETLAGLNEDYAAHRANSVTMEQPVVEVVGPGGFNAWMLAHGKRPLNINCRGWTIPAS